MKQFSIYGNTLKELFIVRCKLITDFAGCYFPNLKKLDVSWTRIDNRHNVIALSSGCPSLKVLDISSCHTWITSFKDCIFQNLEEITFYPDLITEENKNILQKQSCKTITFHLPWKIY